MSKKISEVKYSINLSTLNGKDKLEIILKNILKLLSNNDKQLDNIISNFLNSNNKRPYCIELCNLESIITMELSRIGEKLNVKLEILIS